MGIAGHAGAARAIVARAGRGSLATMALEPAGYPFLSVVLFTLDEDGSPLLTLSALAEHARNLAADARASPLAVEPAEADPLAAGRVTLVGDCRMVPDAGQEAARARFLDAHADATHVSFGDFAMYRLDVKAVRYVGGFGAMSWVEPDAYAKVDP